ncbi:hypothetical protein C0J52_10298 [Blattella germanica]|nr:hypothetical protein C0J52_10298 [Blattella germanica]
MKVSICVIGLAIVVFFVLADVSNAQTGDPPFGGDLLGIPAILAGVYRVVTGALTIAKGAITVPVSIFGGFFKFFENFGRGSNSTSAS